MPSEIEFPAFSGTHGVCKQLKDDTSNWRQGNIQECKKKACAINMSKENNFLGLYNKIFKENSFKIQFERFFDFLLSPQKKNSSFTCQLQKFSQSWAVKIFMELSSIFVLNSFIIFPDKKFQVNFSAISFSKKIKFVARKKRKRE